MAIYHEQWPAQFKGALIEKRWFSDKYETFFATLSIIILFGVSGKINLTFSFGLVGFWGQPLRLHFPSTRAQRKRESKKERIKGRKKGGFVHLGLS